MSKNSKLEEEGETAPSTSAGELQETRRFLGREFLAWTWFESELFETRFTASQTGSFGDCEIWLERSLALESNGERELEKSKLTGEAPSGRPEAREALRQGKLPTQAKLVVQRGEQQFSLVLDADTLGLSGVKIPALLKGEGDEPFYERIQLIEQLEGAIEALYRSFLLLRLDASWGRAVMPAIRAWMREEEDELLDAYRAAHRRSGIAIEEATRGDEGRAPRRSTTVDRVVTKAKRAVEASA
ncbi:MAG: hypothetical protein ABI175_10520 [Polyangiales bacterium]